MSNEISVQYETKLEFLKIGEALIQNHTMNILVEFPII